MGIALRTAFYITCFCLGGMVACIDGYHKYYVTGYHDFTDGGDCTHPAIAVYAQSRIDALEQCNCWDGHSGDPTVWTDKEYLDFRERLGKDFDANCRKDYGGR